MADPTTALGFTLPTVGLDRDTWGGLLNANWSLADSLIAANTAAANGAAAEVQTLLLQIRAYIEPVGSLKLWPAATPPGGWFSCDGQELPRTVHAELFAVIGTAWGAGNGSTTFNLPNLAGLTPVHRGGWINFAQRVGEVTHTLTVAEMPQHTHGGYTEWAGDHSHTYQGPATGGVSGGFTNVPFPATETQTSTAGQHYHALQDGPAGGGGSHNNIQPSVGLNVVIKATQIF